jgi:hypothetical protein
VPAPTPLKKFTYEVKLITVAGYPQPIPIVTGIKGCAGVDLDKPFRRSRNAQAGFDVLGIQFPRGATWAEWFRAWVHRQKAAGEASSKSTFNRVVEELSSGHIPDVVKEGEGEGAIWRVNPTTWASENSGQEGRQFHSTRSH